MTRSIAIISDTHLPRGARRLPAACVVRLEAADLIIHAGDLSTMALMTELLSYGDVVAVAGNVDDAEVRARLPDRLELQVEQISLGVLHDGGPTRGRMSRLRRAFPAADVVVFGHSHVPLHKRDETGAFQIVNPGSPTDKRRQPGFTMGWAEVSGDQIELQIIDVS